MNYWKKISITLLLIIFGTGAKSQLKKDLGIRYEIGNERALLLEFRQPIAEKWRFNTSLGFLIDRAQFSPMFNSVVEVQDSVIVSRQSTTQRTGADLRFGVSRDLKWPFFTVSADVVLGYRFSRYSATNQYTTFQDSIWVTTYFADPGGDMQSSLLHTHSFKPGGMLGFHLNVPFAERFMLTAGVTHAMLLDVSFRRDVIRDPLQEFPEDGWPNYTTFDFDTRFTMGLRYCFGKSKEFPKKD